MTVPEGIYDFVYRGQLAEEALDRAGRAHAALGLLDEEIADKVSLRLLDDRFVDDARRMATVYTAIAAFENTVRDLVQRVLLDQVGADWWEKKVSASVRTKAGKRQDDEAKHRFHTQRGDDPISFIDFSDLLNVMRANEAAFEHSGPRPNGHVASSMPSSGLATSSCTAACLTPKTLNVRHERSRLGAPGRNLTRGPRCCG
ncbi:MAG: hypothetical protein Q8K63_06565 [Acidimicrobiales bacterium]|nr:hypothetical protein [Acidimicrobiales bacterium]